MGRNPYDERHLTLRNSADDIFGYPDTHQGWQDRYQLLLDLAHGMDYSRELVRDEQAFRAFDDNGKVIAYTRAYYRERIFVLNTAVSALALGEVTLNPVEGASAEEFEKAEAIFKRSGIGDDWAFTFAAAGDLYMEPARADAGSMEVTIIPYPPQNVIPVYGMVHRTRLERVTITSGVVDDPLVDAEGNVTEMGNHYVHQRTVDRQKIEVKARLPDDAEGKEQARVDAAASGAHGLGVCPVVHARCMPASYPEHSFPVTHGLDRGLMLADSLITQIKAVGDRYANPRMYVFGAKLADDSDISLFGRILNIFGGSNKNPIEAGYLEPTMAGIAELREQLAALLDDIRGTFPEYLFNGSTANLSAEALQLIATNYERKYKAIRRRLYGALEKALAIGVALEMGREYDPNNHPAEIEGPPLLPANVLQRLQELASAKDLGIITHVDLIKRGQALGMGDPEADPAEYATLINEEEMGRATALMDGDLDPEAGTEADPNAETLAETALNGAQVTGLLAILEQVSSGTLTEDAAVTLMINAFPTLDETEARKIAQGAIPVEELEPDPAQPGAAPDAPPPVGTPDEDTGFPAFEDDEDEAEQP